MSVTSTSSTPTRRLAPTGTGDGEAHLLAAVVDAHLDAVDPDDLRHEHRAERQGQVPVGDGTAEGALGVRPLHVDVDPLVVAGRVGEQVHPLLGDLHVVAVAEVLPDELLELGDPVHDGRHGPIMPEPSGGDHRRREDGAVDGLVGVVLAAGLGTRLRPLTRLRPKALCPVGNVPLVDLALERVRSSVDAVAVNLHHGRRTLDAHLARGRPPLGRGGAAARGPPGHWATCVTGSTVARRWSSTAMRGARGRWTPSSASWDGSCVQLLLAGDDELHPDQPASPAR